MEAATNRRRYARPELSIYGNLAVITTTQANPKNKNDVVQGQDNLKT